MTSLDHRTPVSTRATLPPCHPAVQLCALFIPLGIALVQAALLRVPLPRAFYFACPTMLAGACMIIIPSVKQVRRRCRCRHRRRRCCYGGQQREACADCARVSVCRCGCSVHVACFGLPTARLAVCTPLPVQTVAGSLNTARGWLGFGMAVGQMLSTVFYYTMLQVRQACVGRRRGSVGPAAAAGAAAGGGGAAAASAAAATAAAAAVVGVAAGSDRAAKRLLTEADHEACTAFAPPLGLYAHAHLQQSRQYPPPSPPPPPLGPPWQATRHMGFSAVHLQHYMNCASVLFFTCLSLPLDGAAWGCQFAGWVAKDWLALVGLSTAAYLGSGMLMQARPKGGGGGGAGGRSVHGVGMPHAAAPCLVVNGTQSPGAVVFHPRQVCVWKLGAPTAAMFFGLRLVFAVVLSTPILGSTVIQTGLQVRNRLTKNKRTSPCAAAAAAGRRNLLRISDALHARSLRTAGVVLHRCRWPLLVQVLPSPAALTAALHWPAAAADCGGGHHRPGCDGLRLQPVVGQQAAACSRSVAGIPGAHSQQLWRRRCRRARRAAAAALTVLRTRVRCPRTHPPPAPNSTHK